MFCKVAKGSEGGAERTEPRSVPGVSAGTVPDWGEVKCMVGGLSPRAPVQPEGKADRDKKTRGASLVRQHPVVFREDGRR